MQILKMNQNKTKYIIYGAVAAIILIIAAVIISARRADIDEKREKSKLQVMKIGIARQVAKQNKELVEQGKLSEAMSNLGKIAQIIPENSLVKGQDVFNRIFLIGNSTNSQEEFQKIEEELNQSKFVNPIDIITQKRSLALAASKQDGYERAIGYLESARILAEDSSLKIGDEVRRYFLSGIIDRQSYYYLFLGEIDKAKKLNSQALTLLPENSWAHYTKSLIIMEENPDNKKEALKEAELAYKIFNKSYIKNYNDYSSVSKKISEAYFLFRLGDMLLLNDDLKEAERYLTQVLEAMGDSAAPENYIMLANLYLAKKDYAKTKDYLMKWEQTGRKSPDGYFIKAKLNLALNNTEDGRQNLRIALDLLNTLKHTEWRVFPGAKNSLKEKITNEIIKLEKI